MEAAPIFKVRSLNYLSRLEDRWRRKIEGFPPWFAFFHRKSATVYGGASKVRFSASAQARWRITKSATLTRLVLWFYEWGIECAFLRKPEPTMRTFLPFSREGETGFVRSCYAGCPLEANRDSLCSIRCSFAHFACAIEFGFLCTNESFIHKPAFEAVESKKRKRI